MSSELLFIGEAVRRLGVAPIDVRRLLQAKKLSAIEIQGRWRISTKALQEFMDRRGGACVSCGLIGKHGQPGECIRALRQRIAALENRVNTLEREKVGAKVAGQVAAKRAAKVE